MHKARRRLGKTGLAVCCCCVLLVVCAGTKPSPPISVGQTENGGMVAPDAGNVLRTLRRGHPRLFVREPEVRGLRERIARDATLKRWFEKVEAEGAKMLGEPPVKYELVGPRLLTQSRLALRRITTLGALYLLTDDKRFAARARTELLTAASFKDWNPPHFLDTAEMTNALGTGYDWLYGYLSAQDKRTIRAAIIEKGLREGERAFRNGAEWTSAHHRVAWFAVEHNWNQVCNGGMAVGALAVADEEPELAAFILSNTVKAMRLPMRKFAPDGGFDEGLGYWNYGVGYNVLYLAALESALGTTFDLEQAPGFAATGMFRIHATSPITLAFNFADGGEQAGTSAAMFWLARKFNQPVYAQAERKIIGERAGIFHLLWSNAPGAIDDAEKQPLGLPLDALFRRIGIACFRGSWDNSRAAYVGFKGGDNGFNHSHLDLGSFVFDALGHRWALDLGGDNYNLPGYFSRASDPAGARWTYYRLATRGHNTLVIGDANQIVTAEAPLVAYSSTPARAFAIADLTAAYQPFASSVRRGAALVNRRTLVVQDEISLRQPASVLWQMHTRAKVEINDPRRASLMQGDDVIEARILSPDGARFDIAAAYAAPPNAAQPDVRKLLVRLPAGETKTRLVVTLAPRAANDDVRIEPLAKWIEQGRVK